MPQMAPMLWLVLFAYFVVLYMLFISNFYFISIPAIESSGDSIGRKTSALNWMW